MTTKIIMEELIRKNLLKPAVLGVVDAYPKNMTIDKARVYAIVELSKHIPVDNEFLEIICGKKIERLGGELEQSMRMLRRIYCNKDLKLELIYKREISPYELSRIYDKLVPIILNKHYSSGVADDGTECKRIIGDILRYIFTHKCAGYYWDAVAMMQFALDGTYIISGYDLTNLKIDTSKLYYVTGTKKFQFKCDFSNSEFTGNGCVGSCMHWNASGSNFAKTKFTGAICSKMSDYTGCDFTGSNFTGLISNLGGTTFNNCNFTDAYVKTEATNVIINGKYLLSILDARGADFTGAYYNSPKDSGYNTNPIPISSSSSSSSSPATPLPTTTISLDYIMTLIGALSDEDKQKIKSMLL